MALTTIRQLTVGSEAELEQLLSENPSSIEEKLHVLERQVPAGRGFIDMLAMDTDKTLVVIELKKESDDRILVQGLEYYDFVRDNSERFAQAYPDHDINARVEPRLLLIAGSFNPAVLAAARYVDVPLTLYIYTYLSLGNQRGLYLTEMDISPPRVFTRERKSVEQHINYITEEDAHQACRQVLEWLTQLAPESIDVRGLKYRISVKYKGNNFVDIRSRRSHFNLSWRTDWKSHKKIASPDDFTDEIQEKLRQCLTSMGGLPPDVDAPEETDEGF